jgi:DNA polymerase I-like protein with 3'-5' exonuclease and polymerase domains
MNVLILDVENTVTNRDGKKHLDPFEPTNTLVMIGCKWVDNGSFSADQCEPYIATFDHSEVPNTLNGSDCIQDYLDSADLLVGHNLAHDLPWLWESGFKYNGKIFDTMLAEYVLQRGNKVPLNLSAVAERYRCDVQKQDTLDQYFKMGVSTRDIPHAELSDYLRHDLGATEGIYQALSSRLQTTQDKGLQATVELTNEVCSVLSKMYCTGFKIDLNTLSAVKAEFETEKLSIENKLQAMIRSLMGDTPINLNSPEQLSWVIYSRKPKDKSRWAAAVTPQMTDTDFKKAVSQQFTTLYKTKAEKCPDCEGIGSRHKKRKDGTDFKKATKCSTCGGQGYLFKATKDVAGLKFSAPGVKWASANGFATAKENLEILERVAKAKGMTQAQEFLSNVKRLSALDSYLSNFVDGIAAFSKPDGMLHVRLNQHITATGRFSGSNPNMQNMPRGGTFPVKKVFVSRFPGGKIMEADFAQLEFRTAAFLSQDPVAMKEVTEGFDVHSYTAKIITDAGQATSRQEAKAHTFAPLYGATGYGRTPAEAAYYQHFMEKYKGVAAWHKVLAKQALGYRLVRIPSGREYSFPSVQRRRDGTVTNFTAIKNYPVQGFATADIVPLVLLEIHKRLDSMQSVVVNSVHDSIVIDIHPDEVQQVAQVIEDVQKNLCNLIKQKWDIEFNVPLALEAKIGDNWLEQKELN